MSIHWLASDNVSDLISPHSCTNPLHHPHEATKLGCPEIFVARISMPGNKFPLPGISFSARFAWLTPVYLVQDSTEISNCLKNLQLMPLLTEYSCTPRMYPFSAPCTASLWHSLCWSAVGSGLVWLPSWLANSLRVGAISCSSWQSERLAYSHSSVTVKCIQWI